MKCVNCGARDNRVIDSREVRDGGAIRRRRACNVCGHRFTTYEEVQKAHLQVTKRDGRREEFSREKLMKSLVIACRKRHISVEQLSVLPTLFPSGRTELNGKSRVLRWVAR